jgi:SAM-dependent methyltransferase
MLSSKLKSLQCLCGSKKFDRTFIYSAPPEGETLFSFSAGTAYHREIYCCNLCGHYLSIHDMDEGKIYAEEYVNSTYQDEAGIHRTFDRINSLNPAKSDNLGRVKRILDFARQYLSTGALESPSVLDVGSGLCVFLYRMKEAGWNCTALDPDERAVNHARSVVGVNAIHGDFMKNSILRTYDVITLNKMLEHVEDPVALLARSAQFLKPGGFVYIELPDGERAVSEGSGREEFFIEHCHVFSFTSFCVLTTSAGFSIETLERLREPSTKFTLRGFLTRRDNQ